MLDFEGCSAWKIQQYSKFCQMFEGVRRNRSGFARLNCEECYRVNGTRDVRFSFGWNEDIGVAKCFRCGYRFTMGLGSGSSTFVADIVGFQRPWGFHPVGNSQLPTACGVRDYLYGRGFTDAELLLADVHYSTGTYELGRAIFPHKDPDGSWWGYSARQVPGMCDFGSKVNAPYGVDKTKLYNEVALSEQTQAPLMVVEGVIDAVRFLPDVISTLGKNTKHLFDKILELYATGMYRRGPLVFCYDGDTTRTSRALFRRLRRRGIHSAFVELPPGMDPDSVDYEWLREEVLKKVSHEPI